MADFIGINGSLRTWFILKCSSGFAESAVDFVNSPCECAASTWFVCLSTLIQATRRPTMA